MIHEELSREITPNAFGVEVLNGLKPGLDEKLYERAMIIPDLIVDDVVIVDPNRDNNRRTVILSFLQDHA